MARKEYEKDSGKEERGAEPVSTHAELLLGSVT
jgi:hypothetical protein